MSMKYSQYFAARYVCYNHSIFIIYVSGILQKYYTYHLPDICEYYCYSIHINDYIQSYRVFDRYPIALILTCDNRRNGPDNIKTRIDYIWSDINWSYDILGCDIKNAKLITDSDHNIVKACYNTSNIIRNQKVSQRNKGKKKPEEYLNIT